MGVVLGSMKLKLKTFNGRSRLKSARGHRGQSRVLSTARIVAAPSKSGSHVGVSYVRHGQNNLYQAGLSFASALVFSAPPPFAL